MNSVQLLSCFRQLKRDFRRKIFIEKRGGVFYLRLSRSLYECVEFFFDALVQKCFVVEHMDGMLVVKIDANFLRFGAASVEGKVFP